MAGNYNSWFYLICFFYLVGFATSSSFISTGHIAQRHFPTLPEIGCSIFGEDLSYIKFPPPDEALDVHGGSGRTLLQMKKACNMSFENLDYSIITNKCKGPQYPAKPCCEAFKEFACPYRDAINDLETDCATTMFSYISLYGKYPPGLFANECREDKNGLDCENVEAKKSAGFQIAATQSSSLMLAAGIVVLLFQLF